jgi:endonuclease VIII
MAADEVLPSADFPPVLAATLPPDLFAALPPDPTAEARQMPEGHTIHRLARDHAAWFAGRAVRVTSPQGRFEPAASRLDGRTLESTDAHGKHLFHRYEGGETVHVHLGLFGRFSVHPVPPPDPRDTVRYRIVGDQVATDLVGATACSLLDLDEVDAITGGLGPDPIRDDADPERACSALQRRSVGIGQALMDQRVLAGVGNVYRAELLFVHGVHPELPAKQLPRDRWDAMWDTLVEWLRRGVEEQRIITVDPAEVGTPRQELTRAQATYVYRSDRCGRCEGAVRRWDLAGRWAYACERCQPRPRRAA